MPMNCLRTGKLILTGPFSTATDRARPRALAAALTSRIRRGCVTLHGNREPPQCQGMLNFTDLARVPSDPPEPFTDRLRLAAAAYLARFTGSSRQRTESDLRSYLAWCAERGLDPLAAQRTHLELSIRWMQEIRLFKPSAVSRRFSVTARFYRTCVLDRVRDHSPAEHVRRPAVPAESPTLGFTHLQFQALLTSALESANPCVFRGFSRGRHPTLRIVLISAAPTPYRRENGGGYRP
jgi:hypothetical protein